jgi:hypothetical protein
LYCAQHAAAEAAPRNVVVQPAAAAQRAPAAAAADERCCAWCKRPKPESHDKKCAVWRVKYPNCGETLLLKGVAEHKKTCFEPKA